MSGKWHPMETAPKDGTQILVMDEVHNYTVVEWSVSREAWTLTEPSLYAKRYEYSGACRWHEIPGDD